MKAEQKAAKFIDGVNYTDSNLQWTQYEYNEELAVVPSLSAEQSFRLSGTIPVALPTGTDYDPLVDSFEYRLKDTDRLRRLLVIMAESTDYQRHGAGTMLDICVDDRNAMLIVFPWISKLELIDPRTMRVPIHSIPCPFLGCMAQPGEKCRFIHPEDGAYVYGYYNHVSRLLLGRVMGLGA